MKLINLEEAAKAVKTLFPDADGICKSENQLGNGGRSFCSGLQFFDAACGWRANGEVEVTFDLDWGALALEHCIVYVGEITDGLPRLAPWS